MHGEILEMAKVLRNSVVILVPLLLICFSCKSSVLTKAGGLALNCSSSESRQCLISEKEADIFSSIEAKES